MGMNERNPMQKFIAKVNAALTIEALRSVIDEAVHSDLTHDQLRQLGGLVADRTFALTLSSVVAEAA